LTRTTERKLQANRANARGSSGPKSKQGRRHSARNALRHGLNVPIHLDATLAEEIRALAREIAGTNNGDAGIQELARQVAEADVELQRVRRTRDQLLSTLLSNTDYVLRAKQRDKLAADSLRVGKRASDSPSPKLKPPLGASEEQEKLATVLSREAKQLLVMDRYERRALSRRELAILRLDVARCLNCCPRESGD
jgi:hypothetical protein